nr:WD40 repeat domain-containing protein [Deltaproteobacteria bacterium]
PKGLTQMMVSRDGRWLITADGDGLAQRWNLREPDPSATGNRLENHQAPISAMDLSADGRWLVTADEGGQVIVWDMDQSLPRGATLPKGHEGRVTGVSITDDGSRVVSSSEDMTARNWRLTDGRPSKSPVVVNHEEVSVTAVEVAGDDSHALTGTSEGRVFLWNPTSRVPTRKWQLLESHRRAVTHLEVSADASVVVSAAADNSLVAWDLKAKTPAASSVGLPGHTDAILQLHIFSMPASVPPGRRAPNTAFTTSADGTARSWNLDQRRSGIESRVFTGHVGGIRSVAVSGDGQWAITGGEDGVARVWDWQSISIGESPQGLPEIGSASLVARGHAKGVLGVAVDPFGRRMLTGSADGTARVWDLRNPTRIIPLPFKELHKGPVQAVATSPDPQFGATGDETGTLVIWDISKDRPVGIEFPGHSGEIRLVEFSSDGRYLFSASTDRTVRVWRMGKNAQKDVLVLQHDDEVTRMSLSADGRRLLTGALTEAVLWDLGSDTPTKPERKFKRHEDDITTVAIDPAGRWAVTGSADRRGLLYDLGKKRKKPSTLRGHEDALRVTAFQPTGKWLATGSDDKSIRLWDLESDHPDERSQVLSGHTGGITDLRWSPDGRWLVSASNDGTIRMWDTRKDYIEMVEQALVFEGHQTGNVVGQIALLADDRGRGLTRMVSASYDGTARVWPLEADKLVIIGCTRAGRSLTTDEWDEYIGGAFDPSC